MATTELLGSTPRFDFLAIPHLCARLRTESMNLISG